MKASVARDLLTCRFLVLQSRRLILASLERRLGGGHESVRGRAEEARREVDRAAHAYRQAMLAFGTPEHADYWLIAYARLIEMGNVLTHRLHLAMPDLPPADRYDVAVDVEMLESLVGDWKTALRSAMAKAVA